MTERKGVTAPISEEGPSPEQIVLSNELEIILRDDLKQFQTVEQIKHRRKVILELQTLIETWVSQIYEKLV